MRYLSAILLLIFIIARRKSPKIATLGNFSPVLQTISGRLPNGQLTGNCFPACVASLLGIQLDEVPFFSVKSQKEQLDEANLWLKPQGLHLIQAHNSKHHKHPPNTDYYMMKGESPRFKGHYHVVVGRNNKVVHDPHPDGTGIVGKPVSFFYLCSLS